MKRVTKKMGWMTVVTVVLMSTQLWGAGKAPAPVPATKSNDTELLKMIQTAMVSRTMIAKTAKGYVYAGNDVATTKAKKEMLRSLKAFDAQQKQIQDTFTDSKVKNLMTFIRMNRDEFKDIMEETYSRDNAEVIIDLTEAIAEGNKKIADTLRKRLRATTPSPKEPAL